jgi:hypothetical protein
MKSIDGHASITIRKQKQIFLYEFTVEIYFEAIPSDDVENKVLGKIKINEFN